MRVILREEPRISVADITYAGLSVDQLAASAIEERHIDWMEAAMVAAGIPVVVGYEPEQAKLTMTLDGGRGMPPPFLQQLGFRELFSRLSGWTGSALPRGPGAPPRASYLVGNYNHQELASLLGALGPEAPPVVSVRYQAVPLEHLKNEPLPRGNAASTSVYRVPRQEWERFREERKHLNRFAAGRKGESGPSGDQGPF